MNGLIEFITGLPAEAVPPTFSVSLWVLIIVAAAAFLAGLFTRNYSHVDRVWSLLPPVYAIIWGVTFFSEPLYLIPAILVILWGSRLTFNFVRRGGYAFDFKHGFTEEDYRWPILREKIPNRFLFELFNLFFIVGVQLGIVFLFTLPLFFVGMRAEAGAAALTTPHVILALLWLLCLIGEFIADNQQYNFQENKQSRGGLGFNTKGMWKYSRHPNYTFELLQWIILAVYALVSGVAFIHAFLGAIILVILFVGSTRMTENITLSKYPDYKQWQRITSPWIPGIKTFILRNSRSDEKLGLESE
jgi:steroid 5-alpha reductase family enzyme